MFSVNKTDSRSFFSFKVIFLLPGLILTETETSLLLNYCGWRKVVFSSFDNVRRRVIAVLKVLSLVLSLTQTGM